MTEFDNSVLRAIGLATEFPAMMRAIDELAVRYGGNLLITSATASPEFRSLGVSDNTIIVIKGTDPATSTGTWLINTDGEIETIQEPS